ELDPGGIGAHRSANDTYPENFVGRFGAPAQGRIAFRKFAAGSEMMLAIVNTPGGAEPVAVREVAEPELQPNEALVAVQAFSLNRGELRLFQVRPEGWRPGQDIAGVVVRQAADGSGPAA